MPATFSGKSVATSGRPGLLEKGHGIGLVMVWYILDLFEIGVLTPRPGSERIKPKYDMEVKESKSEVVLGLHVCLKDRLSHG